MEDRCGATEPVTMKVRIRWAYYGVKHYIQRKWHAFYWRALHLTKLAGPYSRTMCRLGLYPKFLDGRCHWCGKIHHGRFL